MIFQLLFFILLLLATFLLSKRITNQLYTLFFFLTGNMRISLGFLAFLLLPGTIIHELSHLITAILLRVPAGNLTVFPTIGPPSSRQNRDYVEVKAGSVKIAKTDPFRHTIIGLAPMLIGLGIIYFIDKIFFSDFTFSIPYTLDPKPFLGFCLLFITTLTMFSSKKDVQALLISGPIAILIGISLYLSGVRVLLATNTIERIAITLSQLNNSLLLAGIFDGVLLLLLFFLTSFIRKVFR